MKFLRRSAPFLVGGLVILLLGVHVILSANLRVKAPDYGLAPSILGADFITPEEVAKAHRGTFYTTKQIATLIESLPSEKVLEWCKENGYVVMPAPPTAMSTLDIPNIGPSNFLSRGAWYYDQEFARKDKTSFGWLLIKKTRVSNSINKTWDEQNELLSALEKVPNAAEVCWFITTYFKVRNVQLFKGAYVRTSSLDSNGGHVYVGVFDYMAAPSVNFYWDDDRHDYVGLSAARK